MDNFRVDITNEGKEHFIKALSFFDRGKVRVTGYRIEGKRLVLYCHNSDKATKLPYDMTLDQAADFVYGWLQQADYGKEPDHDGSNKKGWRVYCEDWGQVGGEHSAFIAIEPAWAIYGK